MVSASPEQRIRELEEKLARADAALAKAAHERDEYRKLYELVTLELERVKRYLRAQNKSERVDAAQVQLAFAQVADLVLPDHLAEQIANDENDAADRRRKGAKAHGRAKLPEHLPLERIVLEPPESLRQCTCCGSEMHTIGEETSERLDWRPGSLVRVQTARIKYACKCEEGGVVIADVPDAVVDRGLALPGLLAHVVVSKYADHLPLNRQEQMFSRLGVSLSRSTLCDWVAQVADLLSPIAAAMGRAALSAHRIHTDDTGIAVQAVGKTQRSHVWVYVADNDHVVFRFTARRKSEGPREFLKGYTGYVQADAANLYDKLFGDGGAGGTAIEVGCWAHARRRFFDAQVTDKDRSLIALGFIKKLYEVDHAIAKLAPSRRTDERRARAGPVLEAFKKWLEAESLVVLPKAPIADAINYTRNQWSALTRFLDDARLRLDNNDAERQLRSVAIGRKNWLFAGSEEGADRACILYTLIASCRLHGVNAWEYLRDVLQRIATHRDKDVLELSPKFWKKARENVDATQLAAQA